ncbi:helix-turn-helix domain-containing protein [Enterococcus sp. LJL51]|uniref:helix-turn-helix domain-containing protein n=1 Tax=Enterococcus sp. LJL51 TaxID=3416656 RepID=UPI003CF33720
MILNDLLMEDDRYKWYILQYLELNKSFYCSLDQICDLLEISRYKIEKYIHELKEEMNNAQFTDIIDLMDTGEIVVHDLSHKTVKKMRVLFIERSLSFQIFHRYVTKEVSLDKQIEALHVSRSSTYRLYQKLKNQLSEENIQIKKNRLVGSEFGLRSFLFGIYYELFNGLKDPFPEEIKQLSRELFQHLVHYKNLVLPKTKEHKLRFMIELWLIRLSHGHFVSDAYISVGDSELVNYLSKWLNKHFSLEEGIMEKERTYLLLFLKTLYEELDEPITYLESKQEIEARQITEELLLFIAKNSSFEIDILLQDNDLTKGLLAINRKWLNYHFRESTFVTKVQRRYFQEINPKLDKMIQQFIQQIEQRQLFESAQEKNKLYYDYLFFLITKISVEKLEEAVYICIDFSHGKHYNDYIKMMLGSLQSAHIQYEERLSTRTQMYLSDFLIDKLPCHQIIWKRPPTPEDWAEFGKILLKVKGESYE